RALFYDANNVNTDTWRFLNLKAEKDKQPADKGSILIKPVKTRSDKTKSNPEKQLSVAKDKVRASERRLKGDREQEMFWYKIHSLLSEDYTDVIVDTNHHPLNFEYDFDELKSKFENI